MHGKFGHLVAGSYCLLADKKKRRKDVQENGKQTSTYKKVSFFSNAKVSDWISLMLFVASDLLCMKTLYSSDIACFKRYNRRLGHSTCVTLTSLTPSVPSSKSTFSQPFKEKCISEVVRTGTRIILGVKGFIECAK